MKKMIAMLLALVMALSLAACGEKANDGSTDNSWKVIENLGKDDPCVHGLKFRRNYGKSAALYCGVEKAKGDVGKTKDAD